MRGPGVAGRPGGPCGRGVVVVLVDGEDSASIELGASVAMGQERNIRA